MARLALQTVQQLSISQLQRLTIQIMTLHGQDLRDFLQKEVDANPLIDLEYTDVYSGGAGREKPLDQSPDRQDSWLDEVMKQLRLQDASKEVIMAAGLIIQHLDEKGFLTDSLGDIGEPYHFSEALMTRGLALVQSLDPAGLGSRSIQECLLIQTRRHHVAPAQTEEVLRDFYDDFLQGRWEKIEKGLHISSKHLHSIRQFLKTLSLQPVATVDTTEDYIRPDMELYVTPEGTLAVRTMEDIPRLLFRQDLYETYGRDGSKETARFIRKAKQGFLTLEQALAYRWQSITTVVTYMAKVQQDYFLKGQPLRPLLQRQIAADTGLSEATVSRVCRDRYVLWQGKVMGLQQFLGRAYPTGRDDTGISDKAIMERIKALIATEDKARPLSDQALTNWFTRHHIPIARRTVTKFRMNAQIPSSTMRRRLHKLEHP